NSTTSGSSLSLPVVPPVVELLPLVPVVPVVEPPALVPIEELVEDPVAGAPVAPPGRGPPGGVVPRPRGAGRVPGPPGGVGSVVPASSCSMSLRTSTITSPLVYTSRRLLVGSATTRTVLPDPAYNWSSTTAMSAAAAFFSWITS